MCLAIPARVIVMEGADTARVDLNGNRWKVSTLLLPGTQSGDWVLVHAGFAIQRLDPEQAESIGDLLEELQTVSERAEDGEPER